MIAILFPYRNRAMERVQRSLASLQNQTNTNFKVYFINYGSSEAINQQLPALVHQFPFVTYLHVATQNQPWNKSRALNSVIKNLTEAYCFVADIDMIFHPNFIQILHQHKAPNKVTYFKVGFLHKNELFKATHFEAYNAHYYSTKEATGMSLFPVQHLKEVRGFDEFYHFWGAEDTDMHVRLQNKGLTISFFDAEVLLLHQWHASYRTNETNKLTTTLRLHNVVRLNHEHVNYAKKHKITLVNDAHWGEPMEAATNKLLSTCENNIQLIPSTKAAVDHFLLVQLKELQKGCYCFAFKKQVFLKQLKHVIKKVVGKSVQQHYSLKEINDLLLTAVLYTYQFKNYTIKISSDLTTLQIAIKV